MQPDPIVNQQEACQAAEKGHDELLKALTGAAGIIYATTQDLQREYYALSDQLAAATLLEQALQPLIDLIESQGSDDTLRNTPISTRDREYWIRGLATEVNGLLQSSSALKRKVLDVNRLAREKLTLPLREEDAFKEIETTARGTAHSHWSLDADKMHSLYKEYFINEVLAGYYEYITGRMEKCTNLAMIRDMFHDIKVSQLLLGDTIQVVIRNFPVSTTVSVTIKGKQEIEQLLERKRRDIAEKVQEARRDYVDTTTAWYTRLWNGTPAIRAQKGVGEQYFEGVTELPFPILDPLDLDQAKLPEPIKVLLTANVSLEACDAQGNTLAMLAARGGFPKIVGRLLAGGANPYSLNKQGLSLFQQIPVLYQANLDLVQVGAEHQVMLQTHPLLPEVRHALMEENGEPRQMAIMILQLASQYLQAETDAPDRALEALFLRANDPNAIQERTWASIFQGFFDRDGVKGQRMDQLKKIIRVCWLAILLEDDNVLTNTFKGILSTAVAGLRGRHNSRLLRPVFNAVEKLERGQGRVMTVPGSELFHRNSQSGALVRALAQRDQELTETRLQLAETRELVAQKDETIAEKDETIAVSQAQVAEQGEMLNKTHALLDETKKAEELSAQTLVQQEQEILRKQNENERLQAILADTRQQAKETNESADRTAKLVQIQTEVIRKMEELIARLSDRLEEVEKKQRDDVPGDHSEAKASGRVSPTQMRRS